VLERRPALLAATGTFFGGNLDNFTPRSGCREGRGRVTGFPEKELDTYHELSAQADGNYYSNHHGTMRFGLASDLMFAIDTLMLNPRAALAKPAPPRMKPYETWSFLSPVNRATFERLAEIADPLREKLTRHYEQKGLSTEEARAASEHALFESVWGADCGGSAPAPTLRRLLVERAPVDGVRAFIAAREHRKTERFAPLVRCAESAGMDPLLHVAVTHPDALPLVWQLGTSLPRAEAEALDLVMEPNLPNGFGKTPLMVAAQFDQEGSARFLLDHGADPNARTWKHDDPALGHDARTALMYAAASSSLATIRLLVNAGADIHAADTKGAKALDYLVGRGPLPPNEKLSPSEFGEAVRLLF
ncbi:MAG TPA: ankyrin repeat domain-containing protein, partial [Polyangiaceae bacterium]|nr:ankyrin repeat domain-containing protein [Polyangiaceae bacterium]